MPFSCHEASVWTGARRSPCTPRHVRATFALGIVGIAATSCSLDGLATESDSTDPWACIGHVPPLPKEAPDVRVRYPITAQGANKDPIPNIVVKGCDAIDWIDLRCDSPVDEPRKTDANGNAEISLYLGYTGYLEMIPNDPNLIPQLFYVPTIRDKDVPGAPDLPITFIDKSSLAFGLAAYDKQLQPGAGHMFFQALDCSGALSAGLIVTPTKTIPATVAFYQDGNHSGSADQTQTSSAGTGGFFNLPPGTSNMTMARVDGEKVGLYNVMILPDSITLYELRPNNM